MDSHVVQMIMKSPTMMKMVIGANLKMEIGVVLLQEKFQKKRYLIIKIK